MNQLAALLGLSEQVAVAGFVVFVRVGAMMATLPAFGEQSIPARMRIGISFAFVLIVAPAVPLNQVAQLRLSIIFPEAITGLFFGLMLRFFIIALQVAGAIAAQSTSLSQIFGGSAGVDPQPAIGRTLVVTGLALAMMMGLHVQVAAYILNSYEMVPVGEFLSAETVASLGTDNVARSFSLGFVLAAPFVIASLIYNVTLGVINRAMPQLMVSFVGAPAITAGGLLLFFASAPLMLGLWQEALEVFIQHPFGSLR